MVAWLKTFPPSKTHCPSLETKRLFIENGISSMKVLRKNWVLLNDKIVIVYRASWHWHVVQTSIHNIAKSCCPRCTYMLYERGEQTPSSCKCYGFRLNLNDQIRKSSPSNGSKWIWFRNNWISRCLGLCCRVFRLCAPYRGFMQLWHIEEVERTLHNFPLCSRKWQ